MSKNRDQIGITINRGINDKLEKGSINKSKLINLLLLDLPEINEQLEDLKINKSKLINWLLMEHLNDVKK